jgi:ribA/ribD-fused uncharacterized protein
VKIIDTFEVPEYNFLSNMYEASFVCKAGFTWKSSEHYYQASKMTTSEDFEAVMNTPTPKKSKTLARSLPCIENWSEQKVEIMLGALLYKFDQNADLKEKLLSTGNSPLIEGNYWGDTFWGVCDGKGRNTLGLALMFLRDVIYTNTENKTTE